MKVLIVCSGTRGLIIPFITEQVNAIKKKGIDIDYYILHKKGIFGYLQCFQDYWQKVKEFSPDIIHAHFGLSGLFANLQRKIPVIVTYHGTDINKSYFLFFSRLSTLISAYNIYVNETLAEKILIKRKYSIVPCGIDLQTFITINKDLARTKLGFETEKKYILFASRFVNPVKNAKLAFDAIKLLDEPTELIELDGYNREAVCLLLNAVDMALLTSFSEGSPQFIKEAMACNCPIVATDVGDIKERTAHIAGCYITSFEPRDVAQKIKLALHFGRINARDYIAEFDNSIIASRIVDIYNQIYKNR